MLNYVVSVRYLSDEFLLHYLLQPVGNIDRHILRKDCILTMISESIDGV